MSNDLKPTNPKDVIGSGKLPLELVPSIINITAALAFFEGAQKYGRFNWRVSGVRASIYKAALDRHIAKWWNGEDCDPVTKVPHLANAIACIGIILDADISDKLTDDRPPPQPDLSAIIDGLSATVTHLKELFKDHHPKQFTIADIDLQPASFTAIPNSIDYSKYVGSTLLRTRDGFDEWITCGSESHALALLDMGFRVPVDVDPKHPPACAGYVVGNAHPSVGIDASDAGDIRENPWGVM